MSRQVVVDIIGDPTKFNSATNSAVNSAGKLDKGFRNSAVAGLAMGAAFSVVSKVLDAGVQFIGNSIEAASDLSETVSKVGVVFGDASADVLAWGEDSATAFGMSKNQALAAAGTYGNLLVSMGLTTGKASEMSTSMVELAADMASFNNASPADTLAAIQSGLTGETEPLKKFGVNLNEATLKAKALDLGLYNGVGTLSAAAKAQASYALILEQTGTAQGDFTRTSDGLANQQRITEAKMADLSATIGEKLLPIMVGVQQFVVDTLIPAFMAVADAVGPIVSEIAGVIIPIFKAVAPVVSKVFGVVLDVIKRVITAVRPVIESLGRIFGAVFAGIGTAVGLFTRGFDVAKGVVTAIVNTISNVFAGLGRAVSKVWDGITGAIKAAINGVIGIVNGMIRAINRIQVHIDVGPVQLHWYGLNIPTIPRLHQGGIVPGQPGADVLTMLQAGERVTPAGGGGGAGVTIVFNGPVYGDGIEELANKLAHRLRLAGA